MVDKKEQDLIYSATSGGDKRICTSVKKHSSYLHVENAKVMKIYRRKLPVGLCEHFFLSLSHSGLRALHTKIRTKVPGLER